MLPIYKKFKDYLLWLDQQKYRENLKKIIMQ